VLSVVLGSNIKTTGSAGSQRAQHEECLIIVFVRAPIEFGAELRHLDPAVDNIAYDERMKDFLNLPVDRLENVDLGWGHRPVSLIVLFARAFKLSPSQH
jgi:hypothetical protein